VLQHPRHRELRERQPGLLGQRRQLLDTLEHLVPHEALHRACATLLVGGAGPGRRGLTRLVLAGEHALSDRRPDDHLRTAREPVAVRDLTDREAAAAETSKFHAATLLSVFCIANEPEGVASISLTESGRPA